MTIPPAMAVLRDALREGRTGIRHLLDEALAETRTELDEFTSCGGTEYRVLGDGCMGDQEGLSAALAAGAPFVLIVQHYDDSEGYGHHGGDAVFALEDGRLIHASCGGCSCEGSGEWSFAKDIIEAISWIPDDVRDQIDRSESDD